MSVSVNGKKAVYTELHPELKGKPEAEIISNADPQSKMPLLTQTSQTQQTAQTPEFDNTGLSLEKTNNEEIERDPQEFITDEDGNEVLTETEDGEVIRKTIRSKDQSGNLIETIISYNGGKPSNKIEKKNGNTISSTKFTYHTKSEESEFEYVAIETENPDKSSVKTNVLSTDEYGNYDKDDFISETKTKPDGTITQIIISEDKIIETETRFDGSVTETLYNGSDLSEYHSGNLTPVQYDNNGIEITKSDEYKVDIKTVKKTAKKRGITNIEITEKNAELILTLLKAEDINGKACFSEDDIKKLSAQNLDQTTVLTILKMMKNDDGSYSVEKYTEKWKEEYKKDHENDDTSDYLDFWKSMDVTTVDNMVELSSENYNQQVVQKLLGMEVREDKKDYLRFLADDIKFLSNKDFDQKMVDKFLYITENADGTGEYRFNGDDIKTLSKLDQKIVDRFLNITKNLDGTGKYRFKAYEIEILSELEDTEIDKFIDITKNADGTGEYRFSGTDINILAELDQEMVDKFMNITKNADGTGEYRFSGTDINTLSKLDQEMVDKFIDRTDSTGKYKFDAYEIAYLSKLDQEMVDKFINIKNLCFDGIITLIKLSESNEDEYKKITDTGLLELLDNNNISHEKCKQLFDKSVGINEHTKFSERTLSEIRLMNEQVLAGETPSLVHKNSADASKTGDVYEENGELFVREKDGSSTKLSLTKEEFDKLFPPLSSSFNQGNLGDCWLISAIDGLMDKPQGRAAVYKMFEHDADGSILVTIPKKGEKPIKFKNGEVLDNQGKQVSGDLGIKMLEMAYAIHRQNHYNDTTQDAVEIDKLTKVSELMEELKGGFNKEAWKSFTKNHARCKYGYKMAAKLIEKYANNPEVMIGIAFKVPSDTQTVRNGETVIDKSYYLYGRHAYAIKGYDPDTKTVCLTNPWNTSTVIEVPINLIEDNFAHIDMVKL